MTQQFKTILLTQRRQHSILFVQAIGVAIIVLIAFIAAGFFDFNRLSAGIPDLIDVIGNMFPPDFSNARNWLKPIIDTLAMSIAGTALAIAISLPLAFLAAKTTSPNPFLYQGTRVVLNILRAIPELIMGIIFVAAVGFGILPGVLAVGLHSVGMVGKFFAESIEHADHGPIEAIQAVGADRFQVIYHSVLPQVLPQIVDVSLYRWEYNFRASTIMGAVGAGGIGFELIGALRLLQYESVGAILIVILVMVTIVDSFSSVLRRYLA
ncbi:MAG: phosphonate ABC transporter, permease protein PhnE [Cyanobacteria bacterium P01_D01_bin.115]